MTNRCNLPSACTCWVIPSRTRSRRSCTTPCTSASGCRGATSWPTWPARTRRARSSTRATSCRSTSPRRTSRTPSRRPRKGGTAKLALGANALVKMGKRSSASTPTVRAASRILSARASTSRARWPYAARAPRRSSILHACAVAGAAWSCSSGATRSVALRARRITSTRSAGWRRHDRPAGGEAHHRSFRRPTTHHVQIRQLHNFDEGPSAVDLVVNATPLGMNEGDAPLRRRAPARGAARVRRVYGHGETAFVPAARAAGCTVSDGAGMLVAQAVATVRAVCDLADVDVSLSDDDLFEVMADAAHFDL